MGSKRLLKNANWARYNLAVSRRKETEPSSSSVWNFNLPGSPPVDFHNFFNGENITQEDLVAWINVGMHHLVRSYHVSFTDVVKLDLRSHNPRTHLILGQTLLQQGMYYIGSKRDRNVERPMLHSFLLTPLNYFDHDVSIDSTNAILLQAPSNPGDPFTFEDYGVRPAHCVPRPPAPFEYSPVHVFDHRGEEAQFESVEAMRAGSELYHRLKFGF